MYGMDEERNTLKLIAISGAAHAIRYKEENPRAHESEVIQHVTDKVDDILAKIKEGESGN